MTGPLATRPRKASSDVPSTGRCDFSGYYKNWAVESVRHDHCAGSLHSDRCAARAEELSSLTRGQTRKFQPGSPVHGNPNAQNSDLTAVALRVGALNKPLR
jgi:hypothetical protein